MRAKKGWKPLSCTFKLHLPTSVVGFAVVCQKILKSHLFLVSSHLTFLAFVWRLHWWMKYCWRRLRTFTNLDDKNRVNCWKYKLAWLNKDWRAMWKLLAYRWSFCDHSPDSYEKEMSCLKLKLSCDMPFTHAENACVFRDSWAKPRLVTMVKTQRIAFWKELFLFKNWKCMRQKVETACVNAP